MITLRDWMETVNYRITEGSEYFCSAFGNNLYSLSAWNGDHDGWSMNIVFDTREQYVYLVEACDYKNQRAYRLIDPDYKNKFMKDDSEYRDQAWDDVNYIDLETDEDFLDKAESIVSGEDYDTRVSIPLELPEEELMVLFKAAHARDMTFNDFVEEALREALKEWELDTEGMRARATNWKEQNDAT